ADRSGEAARAAHADDDLLGGIAALHDAVPGWRARRQSTRPADQSGRARAAVGAHGGGDGRQRMSGRTIQVLSRFPAHLEAPRRGKQLEVVADAISTLLDELSTDLAEVRRSHRLGDADIRLDVERLGALHAIGGLDYDAVLTRLAAIHAQAAALAAAVTAHDTAARDGAANALLDLYGV